MSLKKVFGFKKAVATLAFAVLTAEVAAQGAETTQAPAPLNFTESNAEWHFVNERTDKLRLNLFFNLPFNIKSYSFMEFLGKNGYYGKTQTNIPTGISFLQKIGLGVKAESKHTLLNGNYPIYSNTIGFGLEKGTMLPRYSFLSVKFLPVVLGKEGLIENNMVAGYFLAVNLFSMNMFDLKLTSYGDVNIAGKDYAGKEGPIWDYGENHLTVYYKSAYGKFYLGGGVNHNYSGKFKPESNAVFKIGYHVVK